MSDATALWMTSAGRAEVRPVSFEVAGGDVVVRTLFSGISRGTERLVFSGAVPESEHETMRAPFQEGDFSFPVKYGYSAVGKVESGPSAGEVVFSLFPHQTRFAVPAEMAVPVPGGVPAGRAVLAANMETALNIVWDSGMSAGDRVAVIGAGVVGALVGYLCARMPGAEVTLVDVDPAKAELAEAFGCGFAAPGALNGPFDVLVNTSASAAGLQTCVDHAGVEARVVEASWYGDAQVPLALGGAFHQKRLQIVSSQVGRVPAGRAARWSYRRRMEMALRLLADPVLDQLISGETAFSGIAGVYGDVLASPATLCHRIAY